LLPPLQVNSISDAVLDVAEVVELDQAGDALVLDFLQLRQVRRIKNWGQTRFLSGFPGRRRPIKRV
jgi:hypothetical protein